MSVTKTMPVVKRVGKDFEIVEIPMADILYQNIISGVINYRTSYGIYTHITTLEEMERYLSGEGFRRVERGYLVQMSKVDRYDADRDVVDLGNGITAPVSRAHRKDVLQYAREVHTTTGGGRQLLFNYSSG